MSITMAVPDPCDVVTALLTGEDGAARALAVLKRGEPTDLPIRRFGERTGAVRLDS
jgi:hypothetical protein